MVTKMAAWKGATNSGLPASAKRVVPHTQRHLEKRIVAEEPCLALTPGMAQVQEEEDVDVNLSEVYFLIMHFLSGSPCNRATGQLWNELLQYKLLPRRYHAWFSRTGIPSGDEDDDGISFPLSYIQVVERNPNIEKNHLVKLLRQQLIASRIAAAALEPPKSRIPTAADVPTVLGLGSYSLLNTEPTTGKEKSPQLLRQLRWPHCQMNQVCGLTLRELGGGFSRHHHSPSIRAASYAIMKPSILVDKIQIIKKFRGHRNAVYCAIFDRTGQHIITGSDDRLVKIWSTDTGFCLRSCRGHEGDITELSVSSGNALVASASNDCTIRVWRLPDGVPISVLRGHTGAVTAIAFSPRQSCEHHLLSSSDDGTCRIWDARDSSVKSRVYMPSTEVSNPSEKPNVAAQPVQQAGVQFSCCAFNADGSIFVTGSSDRVARVWDARKWNDEISGKPNHELDVLKGHENAVNYVQFSGCAGPVKPNTTESAKEDRTTKFKNSWLTCDSIVTCSRDGSAIIWIYKSRRKDARYGRWMKAYHLRVPPPPMPSHPPRGGGPRQRFLPTPRGVNMIVWSLDNRFVLAAIMDCRICVWNAVDGSLVHSLTGHTKLTFVVDVHPFNPRIAMSAGYDGRVIIWDIWEGQPVREYETGDFQIVDGNFSPDGTSLVVSDEVGQVYLLTTGQGQSQKDAKYDQFFLGDFRPLVRDIQGNVLDQETQLPPHQRNIQDLLCDANMIPYQEPYQSMYQQRRLGALGIDWQPLHVNLAVGTDDINYISFADHPLAFHPNVQGSPVNTAEDGARRWVEQPTDAHEEMDWEQDVTRLSDDSGSDYSASEENLSLLDDDEGTASSTEGMGHSDEEEGDREEGIQEAQLRRSNRNKRKAEGTPSDCHGRKVGKLPPDLQQVDERIDEGTDRRPSRQRQADLESSAMRPASQQQLARPKRVAAKNALQLFSHISTNEDGDEEEASSSQQETSSCSTEQEPKSGGLSVDLPLSCNWKNDEDAYQTQEKDNVIEAEGREEVSESIGKEVMLETEEKGLKEDERGEDLEVQENPEKDVRGEDSRSNAQQESHTMYKKDEIFCEDENNEDFGMVPKEDALEKDISAARPDRSEPGDFSRRPRSQRRLVLKLWNNETDIMESLSKVELEDTVSNGKIVTPKANQIMTSRDHTKRKLRRLIVKPPQAAPLFHDGFGGLSDTGDNGDYSGIQNAGLLMSDHEQARLPGNHSRHSIRKKRKGKGQSVVVQVTKQAKGVHETVTVEPTGSSPSSLSCSNDRSASICGAYQDRSGEAPGGVYLGVALEISSHYRDTDSGGTNGARNLGAIPSHINLPTREVEPPGRRLLEARPHRPSSPESSARFHPLNARYSNIYQRQEEAALQNDKLMIRSCIGVKSNQVDMNSQMNNAGRRWWHTTDHANRMAVEEPQQGDDGKTRNSLRGVSNGMDNAVHTRKGRKMFAHNTSEVVDEYDDSQFSQMMQEGGYQDHVSEIPLKSNAHSSSTKRTFVTKRFKSKEREVRREDSDGAVQGSSGDRVEAGQCLSEGHSESDFGQDNASWSELGSAEGGQSDAHYLRHKRRTLGEIESTNNTVQNFSEDLMGKRRVRHMRSVMLEGVRETRLKGNRWRRAAVNKEKEALENQGSSRRQRAWTDTMSWRNNCEGEDPGVHVDNAADRLTQTFGELHATNSYRSRGTDLGRFGQVGASVPMEKKGLRVSSRTRRERTRTSDRDQRRQVETITVIRDKSVRTRKSLAWLLLLEVEEGTRYIPQFGDEVAYLRQGHKEYLDVYKIDEPGPWTIYDDALLAVEICQVVGLEYAVLVDSGETCCKLTLEFSDHTSQLQGKTFSLTLSELTNFPDFIVERSRYEASIERRWTNRDRCKVWWRSQNGQGGEWWEGRVIAVKSKSFDFAESPWERFLVQYKSDPNKPYSHSPWELFDRSDARWEPPHIDQHMRERLLSVLESAANEPEDAYGLRKLKQSSCKSDFINRLPLPLTLDVLKQRLEKDYYHSSQAFYFDVQLLATNANTYCGVQHPMAQGLQAFARDMQKEISCESSC